MISTDVDCNIRFVLVVIYFCLVSEINGLRVPTKFRTFQSFLGHLLEKMFLGLPEKRGSGRSEQWGDNLSFSDERYL